MNSSMIRTLVTLSLSTLLSPVAVLAQNTVKADIPFDFVAGNRTLAAGTYTVHQMTAGAILLQNAESGNSILVTFKSGEVDRVDGNPKMTFNRYGDTYFLTKVSSDTRNWTVYPSKMEKELIAKGPSSKPGVVTAALRNK